MFDIISFFFFSLLNNYFIKKIVTKGNRSLIGIIISLANIIKYPPPTININPILPVDIKEFAGSSLLIYFARIPVFSPF